MEEREKIRLRAHHLLCMQQFDGYGYSDGFSVGMGQVIDRIRADRTQELLILDRPDVICKKCPNLREDSTCELSDEDVRGKDRGVIDTLGLEKPEQSVRYETLHDLLIQRMNREAFESICGDCRWKEQGLCGYEKLRARLCLPQPGERKEKE